MSFEPFLKEVNLSCNESLSLFHFLVVKADTCLYTALDDKVLEYSPYFRFFYSVNVVKNAWLVKNYLENNPYV